MRYCPWCDYPYPVFDIAIEESHLRECHIYQRLPVAETLPDGRQFILLPGTDNILVERVRVN